MKPTGNLLVVFEETGGDPREIKILTVNRDTICSFISDYHPPQVKSWERTGNQMRTTVDNLASAAHLSCPGDKVIKVVEFASYGDPYGGCGSFIQGNCTAPDTVKLVEKYCLGKNECSIPMEKGVLLGQNKDACPDVEKSLAVQVRCAHANNDD